MCASMLVCITKDLTCSQVKGKSRAQSIRTTATERMKKVTNTLRNDCRRGEIISMTVYFCYDINYTLRLHMKKITLWSTAQYMHALWD